MIVANESQIIGRIDFTSEKRAKRERAASAQRASHAEIFLSYRQKDSRGDSRQLYRRLADSFGAEKVFFDVGKIGPGDDWLDVVRSEVRLCHVLIAVIGESWLRMTDEHGKRRLDDVEDPVRIEIAAALAKNSALSLFCWAALRCRNRRSFLST